MSERTKSVVERFSSSLYFLLVRLHVNVVQLLLIFRMDTKKNDSEKEFRHFISSKDISVSERAGKGKQDGLDSVRNS